MNKTPPITTRQYAASGSIFIETLVAISVLMLAVPATLTIASKSVSLASYSKAQIIAVSLAEEGIEIIRHRRTTNILEIVGGATKKWTDGFYAIPPTNACNGGSGAGCRVDYGVGGTEPLIQRCANAADCLAVTVLNKDTVTGTYSHTTGGTWEPTPFRRLVTIAAAAPPASDPTEIRVTSEVTYTIFGVTKRITLTENLTEWILWP